MFHSEQIEADGCAGNVSDAVQCTYFVKMNLVNGHPVSGRFCLSQTLKYAHRQVALWLGQAAPRKNLFNFRQVAVSTFLRRRLSEQMSMRSLLF